MDKIKKLSDAIELGATFRPQAYGRFFGDGRSCALGAASEAVYGGECFDDRLSDRFPELLGYAYFTVGNLTREHNQQNEVRLASYITFLNDVLRLTREEIAAWLRLNNY